MDKTGLLLAVPTTREIEDFIQNPAQTLMISGLPGSGKTAVARQLAAAILSAEDIDSYPYFIPVRRPEDKKDIPIDDIRSVLRKLRLRTPGRQGIRRVVFIEDAHYLSTEAQNALLKAIEEPAGDTAFILSVPSKRAVLPTITSRAAQLTLKPVTLAQAQSFYAGKHQDDQIASAWQLSQGRPGLLNALLDQESDHPLKQGVENAKKLLGQAPYERLLALDRLSKDKEQFKLLLEALDKVLAALQKAHIGRGGSAAALLRSRRLVNRAQEALAANVSPRLLSLELSLNLKV